MKLSILTSASVMFVTVNAVITPKVILVTGFTPESRIWDSYNLTEEYRVEGLLPQSAPFRCNKEGEICNVEMGMAEIGNPIAIGALWLNPDIDVSKSYWIVNGIGGVNPKLATEGGVAVSQYVVEFELGMSLLGDDLPANFSGNALFPGFENRPNLYPNLSGTEVFELNSNLIEKFFCVSGNVELAEADSDVINFRSLYEFERARESPKLVKCDVLSAMMYWHGDVWAKNAEYFSSVITNNKAQYCITDEDDTGTMLGLLRGAYYGKVDFSRVLVLKGASNFDRPPKGVSAYDSLFEIGQSGFLASLENIFRVGSVFVDDIIENWGPVYDIGISADNYIGDVFGLLGGTPDFVLTPGTEVNVTDNYSPQDFSPKCNFSENYNHFLYGNTTTSLSPGITGTFLAIPVDVVSVSDTNDSRGQVRAPLLIILVSLLAVFTF